MSKTVILNINDIVPDPRRHAQMFEPSALAELSKSVAVNFGEPITVAPSPVGNMYIILSGEMRYAAAVCAGLEEIPAQIVKYDVVTHGTKQPTFTDGRIFINTVKKYADYMCTAGLDVTLDERQTAEGKKLEILIKQ